MHDECKGKEVFLREEKSLDIYGSLKILDYHEIEFKEYKSSALKTPFKNLEELSRKHPTIYCFFKYYVDDVRDIKIVLNERMLIECFTWAEYYGDLE